MLHTIYAGGTEGPMIPMNVAPPPAEDHPDLYIPEEVKHFLPYFEYQIAEKVYTHTHTSHVPASSLNL